MTAKTKARNGCVGCLGLLVITIVILAVVGAGVSSLVSPGKSETPGQDAIAYVNTFRTDAGQVNANIEVVAIDIGSKASIDRVAQDAQQAHDNLDNVRDDFAQTTTTSGNLGNAELEVFTAANDLKNAMGALVTYTGSPNPATLAQFTTQFQTARGEWNDGVRVVWDIAGRRGAPTLDVGSSNGATSSSTTAAGSATTTTTSSAALRSCDPNISAGADTSCPFAENVFKAVAAAYQSTGSIPSQVSAFSPVTEKHYSLACVNADQQVACSDQTGSLVTFSVASVKAFGPVTSST